MIYLAVCLSAVALILLALLAHGLAAVMVALFSDSERGD